MAIHIIIFTAIPEIKMKFAYSKQNSVQFAMKNITDILFLKYLHFLLKENYNLKNQEIYIKNRILINQILLFVNIIIITHEC